MVADIQISWLIYLGPTCQNICHICKAIIANLGMIATYAVLCSGHMGIKKIKTEKTIEIQLVRLT